MREAPGDDDAGLDDALLLLEPSRVALVLLTRVERYSHTHARTYTHTHTLTHTG